MMTRVGMTGLRLYAPSAALIKVPEAFFNRFPTESQVVLAGIGDASEVLRRLLDGGHSVVAGRLAGAFRRIGRADIADEIVAAMKWAGTADNRWLPGANYPSARKAPAFIPEMDSAAARRLDAAAAV